MTISWRYAARSSVGLVRASNQDSAYAGPHLAVMCDGMGGPAGGDIASAVAIHHLKTLDADSHQAEDLLLLLRGAVQEAHADLIARSTAEPDLAGLGTTCIAIMRSGHKLGMVHVGDSRAYLLRDGALTQVTTDHTFVEYLVESGRLTPEEARNHPQRSVLLRVLGDADGDVQLDESIREAVPGDRWLLCSDGLSGPVTADTIAEVLRTMPDPGQAADHLIDLAERAGGPDNITAVILDIVEDDPTPQREPQIVGSAAINGERLAARSASTPGAAGGPASASNSPAAKAAALMAGLDGAAEPPRHPLQDAVDAEAEAQASARRRQRRVTWVSSLLLLVALVAGAAAGYAWSQAQYYVGIASGKIAIYQGIPQQLGPLSLSHVVQTYDEPAVEDLDERMRERLSETVSQPSLEQARTYVQDTVSQRLTEAAQSSSGSTPGSTPSPSPSASSSASPSPSASAASSGGS